MQNALVSMKSFFFLQHFVYGKQCAIMREKEVCDGGKKKHWKGTENAAAGFICKQTVKGTDMASNWINNIKGKLRNPPKK